MEYTFPKNITLDDVKEEIKDNKEFIIVEKDNFTVVNYVYAAPETFDTPLKAELRGLIFCNETGKVINRRFHKFFNVGEKLNAGDIDISKPHVILEKLDGSMISPIHVGGNIR
jgi:RNA ligase